MVDEQLIMLVKSFLAKPRDAANAGERLAWQKFYAVHDDIIRAMVRRIHRDPGTIDDLTQEVWVRVIDGLSNLRLNPALGSITAWVVKIASNVAKRHARIRSKHRAESLSLAAANELPDHRPGPETEFEWIENEVDLRQLIQTFAATLVEREKRVLVLYWLDERSLPRIAVDMMVSGDSAWGILRRVSLKLADCLCRRGHGGPEVKNEKIFRISRR